MKKRIKSASRVGISWASIKKTYWRIRRKYIKLKRSTKQTLRWVLSPILAIRFIIEQIAWGHFPTLDKNMFMTDSMLERWLYYDIRVSYKGKIIPQYPIGSYWADFALPDYKLVIELDGQKYHKNRKDHDRRRDAYMYRMGWKVMRFSYDDVKKRRAITIDKILTYTRKQDEAKKTTKERSARRLVKEARSDLGG